MLDTIRTFVENHTHQPLDAIDELTPGASARQYFRVHLREQTFIVSHTQDKTTFDDFLDIQKYLDAIHIPVPQIFAYDENQHLILQSDAGNQPLTKVVQEDGVESERIKRLYIQAVEMIAQMQFSQSPAPSAAFTRAFDTSKFWFEWDVHLQKYVINGFAEKVFTEPDLNRLRRFYGEIIRHLASQPRYFCHRDFQSSNLMVTADDRLLIVDFQDARLGLAQYDLVSLIEDVYVPLPAALKIELIDHYLKKVAQLTGKPVEKASFMMYYDLTLIQRKLHDAGSFARAYLDLGKPQFLPYIPQCLHTVIHTMKGDRLNAALGCLHR